MQNGPTMPPVRSLLFVSGERPDRFDKAVATGADVVCVDLEDAVHPDRKAEARAHVIDWLRRPRAGGASAGRIAVRINGLGTLDGLRDALALAEAGVRTEVLLVPKVEDAAGLALLHRWLGGAFGTMVALIETPLGIERMAGIAGAAGDEAPRLSALMLGGADLSMELGARLEWDALASARGRLVNAAKAFGLEAWDVPFVDVGDVAGLQAETRRVKAMGFDCKSAIHPSQVAPIHAAMQPDADELAWAVALNEAVAAQGGPERIRGAFLFRGKLVDAPILRRAERVAAFPRHTEQE
jgi:citrate lyase beta subunit